MEQSLVMSFIEREGVLTTPGGRRIGWAERGASEGRPVAYLHGMPGSRKDIQALFTDESLLRLDLRLFAIDRAGYGETDAAGLDRRDVARDVVTLADHLGIAEFPTLAASMGSIYALTLAALEPDRVTRLVLISPNALPYDDPDVIAALSEEERADFELVRNGPTREAEAAIVEAARAVREDAIGLIRRNAARWSTLEAELADGPWAEPVARSLAFGLATGHVGYYEDALRTARPLEFDVATVRCPVRIMHGGIDDWEPLINAQRLISRLPDAALLEVHETGHFGPWLWPDAVLGLITGR